MLAAIQMAHNGRRRCVGAGHLGAAVGTVAPTTWPTAALAVTTACMARVGKLVGVAAPMLLLARTPAG